MADDHETIEPHPDSEFPHIPYEVAPSPLPETVNTGDDGAWMIVYEDADVRPDVFAGCGARTAALATFERRQMSWNCHLFERISDGKPGCTVRALAAERDAAVAAFRRERECYEHAEMRACEHSAYRSAAAAFLASRGMLPEFDAWCEARGLGADAAGRLVDALWQILDDMGVEGLSCCPAAKAQGLDAIRPLINAGDLDALHDVAPGILDQPSEGR